MLKNTIINAFNQGAATYDSVAEVQIEIANQLMQRVSCDSPKSILEIGCGTGILTTALHKKYPDAVITTIDISPKMVAHCRDKLSNMNNITILCEDVETYQFQQKYDLIVSSMTLHWLKDVTKCIDTCTKYLNANGVLAFAMLERQSFKEWKLLCNKFSISNGTVFFPSIKNLKKIVPQIMFKLKKLIYHYDSALAFLRSIKLLGAHTPRKHYVPLSPGKMRDLLRKYNKKYPVSYYVLYGFYKNE